MQFTVIYSIDAFGRSQISVQEGVERRGTSIEDRTGESCLFQKPDSHSCCLNIIDVKISYSIVVLECTSGKHWLMKVLDFKIFFLYFILFNFF